MTWVISGLAHFLQFWDIADSTAMKTRRAVRPGTPRTGGPWVPAADGLRDVEPPSIRVLPRNTSKIAFCKDDLPKRSCSKTQQLFFRFLAAQVRLKKKFLEIADQKKGSNGASSERIQKSSFHIRACMRNRRRFDDRKNKKRKPACQTTGTFTENHTNRRKKKRQLCLNCLFDVVV